jgi:hypothetical protein
MTVRRSDIGDSFSVAVALAVAVAVAIAITMAIPMSISAVISVTPAITGALVSYGVSNGFLLLLLGGEDRWQDDCDSVRHGSFLLQPARFDSQAP